MAGDAPYWPPGDRLWRCCWDELDWGDCVEGGYGINAWPGWLRGKYRMGGGVVEV